VRLLAIALALLLRGVICVPPVVEPVVPVAEVSPVEKLLGD
jgi:hypothetical protein